MSDIKFRRRKNGRVYATVEIPECRDCEQCPIKVGCVFKKQKWIMAMYWTGGEERWVNVLFVPGAGCPWALKEEA
jgi:hypothetical protein